MTSDPRSGEQFRQAVEAALATLPFTTPAGRIAPRRVPVYMGYPGGNHEIQPAWIYERANTSLEMALNFYSNFSPTDLICKVIPAGEYPQHGEGASVQFNGNHCVIPDGVQQCLVHQGKFTLRAGIARSTIVATLQQICPEEMHLAGISDGPLSWPLHIGSTAEIPALLDRIFVFAYCIEQAKRHLREEALLPRLVR
jgi:hypothetical protein